jgi:hypothetical protein
MPTDNSLLFAKQKSAVISTKGYIGDLRYAMNENHASYIRNGFNASTPIAQVTRLTLSAATIPAGEGLYLEVSCGGSTSKVITILNDTAAAVAANTLILNVINGVSVSLTAPSIPGFVAASSAATAVELTGNLGEPFDVVISSIGTFSATSAIIIPTSKGAYIPYGRALVNNALANSLVYPKTSIIADNNDSIVKVADNVTDTFVGISIRSLTSEMGFFPGDLVDGYAPKECVHWVPNYGHRNHILVRIEESTIPVAVDASIYYRHTGATAANPLGGLSIQTDANRALARDTGSNNYWVIKAAVDAGRRLYYIGLKY